MEVIKEETKGERIDISIEPIGCLISWLCREDLISPLEAMVVIHKPGLPNIISYNGICP